MLAQILLDRLEALRLNCEAAILTYTQNDALLRDRDGRVTDGLKYQEGRLVVLSEVIRDLKGGRPRDAVAIAALVAAAAERWGGQLSRHQASDNPALLWVAYSQGGVDAAAEIRRLLNEIEPR